MQFLALASRLNEYHAFDFYYYGWFGAYFHSPTSVSSKVPDIINLPTH